LTQIKNLGFGAVVAALFALVAFATLVGTVSAAVPTAVTVIIDEGNTAVGGDSADDDDSLATSASAAQVVQIVVDVDDAGGQSDETLVTLTTGIGTFSNGAATIVIACANDGANNGVVIVDNDDTAVDGGSTVGITEGTFNGTVEAGTGAEDPAALDEGCAGVAETLIIPAGAATGTYPITATTTNGVAGVNNLVITAAVGGVATQIAHVSQSHDAIGYTASGVTPWVNGTLWTVSVTDANNAGVNGAQVQFTTDRGRLVDVTTVGGTTETLINTACGTTTAMGTSVFDASALVGTSNGRARVVLCGTSDAAGTTANLSAKLVGKTATATDTVTIAGEPTASDITVTRSGDTLEVSVMVGGVPAADDTIVQFSPVPTDSAVVSATCVELHDGKASTTVAVAGGTTASVLVTVSDDSDGSCAAVVIDETYGSKTQQIGGSTAPTTPEGDGEFTGDISDEGVSLVVFGGGSVEDLADAADAAGAISVSLTVNGEFVVYIVGAPDFVNAAFVAAFEDGIEAGTPVILFVR